MTIAESPPASQATNNIGAIAKIVDPAALARAALTGEAIDVTVSVPVSAFGPAYKLLRPIMDDGAPHLEAWLTEEGRSEEELRLLCGLLCTVEDNLPMDTAHHLVRLEKSGFAQHLDEFARRRVQKIDATSDAQDVVAAALKGKDLADVLNALSASVLDLKELCWTIGVHHLDLDDDFLVPKAGI